jgi:hypothetical protein
VLATKLVVEKPVRRATGPMSPMKRAPHRAAVRFGLAFRRELPKLAKKSRYGWSAVRPISGKSENLRNQNLRFLPDFDVSA